MGNRNNGLMFAFQRFMRVNDDEDEPGDNIDNNGDINRFNNVEEAMRAAVREAARFEADGLGPVEEDIAIPAFLQMRREEIIEQMANMNDLPEENIEALLRQGPPFDFMDFLQGRFAIPPINEEVVPDRTYVRPFPLKTECDFDLHNLTTHESGHSWNGLTWSLKCENYVSESKLHVSRLALVFSGMEDKCYKVTTSGRFSESVMNFVNHEQQVLLVDKNYRIYIFPDIQISGPARMDNGMLEPKIKFTFSVDHIELAPHFAYRGQVWPMADRWVTFGQLYSVKLRFDTFLTHHPKFDKLMVDMRSGTLSKKEAEAFFEFAGFLCNRWYVSTPKFHEILMNAFKMGFTENWAMLDTPDSGFDFNTKTLLPFYHDFVNDEPKEQFGFECVAPSGVCQIFKLKMHPEEMHKRNQIETMRFAKGHRGQFTFYLEDTPNGLLLMMGGVFKVTSRQNAKLKLTLFEHGIRTAVYNSHRILHNKQRTFGFVVAALTEEQIDLLTGGHLSVGIQLHFHKTSATFVNTYQNDDDRSSPYVMPGPCNAWIVCRDDKKIGVCKEFIANHCEQLQIMFYNTVFADCGQDTIAADADSPVVLQALEILYHRSLAMSFDSFRGILELAGYWLSEMIKRYVEMAILHTDQIEPSDKLELALFYDLDVIKYIIRHPEYASGCAIDIPAADRARIAIPSANELDGGPDGRGSADGV